MHIQLFGTLPGGATAPIEAIDNGDGTYSLSMGVSNAQTQTTATTLLDLGSGTGDTPAVDATPGLRLYGFACKENAASAAVAEFILRHGNDVSDPIIVPVTLLADESRADWYGPDGIACPNGIFLDRVAGTTQVSVFTKAVT